MAGNKKWSETKNSQEQKVFRKKNCLETDIFGNKKCSGAKSVWEQKGHENSLFSAESL